MLLHIFGGANRANSANEKLSMPDFLLDHEIIVVTFNYRIGPFGFMSLDTPEYPGNMGMKDQQLVIKWVSKNIEHFNGDKTKITLSGHSSGNFDSYFSAHLLWKVRLVIYVQKKPVNDFTVEQHFFHSNC